MARDRTKPLVNQGEITDGGETFRYRAHFQESGGGYSYDLQIDANDPKDIIHMDTRPGTIFTEEDLIVLREYWKLVRARGVK